MHAAASVSRELMDTTHFDDFGFPEHVSDQDPMAFLEEHGHGIGMFAANTQQPSPIPLAVRQGSVVSMANTASGTDGGMSITRQSRAGSEGAASDGEAAPRSLEDTGADEFGLTNTGGAGDGTDLGGKTKDDKTDTTTPAWSELKTKAGKERKRLPLACIACRRKKIRCSGEKPACKHCLRSRIPCVYKVTTRKAAPRTDYMAMLDKRLKRMEERILKIVPAKDGDGAASSVSRAVLKPSVPGASATSKSASKKRPAEEAFAEPDLEAWANGPSRSKIDGPNKPTSLQIQEAEENKLFSAGIDALPPKEIQEHLAEVFFENIYGQAYHLLHKPSYMRKLKAGTLPPVLVLSVCSVAARFSTHPRVNTEPNFLRGEEWALHAREICTTRYEWPNITILTCLLILGLHEFGTCHGGRSWALGGQAIRMAFALQLHKDLEHDPQSQQGTSQLSFIDREIRRRTMWACFLMDRFNSSGTDRPTFIKEETIKIPLPIKEKYFQLDMPAPTETLSGKLPDSCSSEDPHMSDAKDNIGVAAYMIKTIAIWGRIIGYLNQGGRELDPHPIWSPESGYSKLIKDAEEILTMLPESLKYSHDNLRLHDTENMVNQYLFLHISMQQNILFLNRIAVVSPPGRSGDIPKGFVSKAGAKTFAAANRISDLLRDAEPYLVAAPFVGYCAFSSATIHVIGIFSGSQSVEAASKKNLTVNVKFLSKMKRYWGMFHWMSENLREQYRSYADAARYGSPEKAAASPIFQYGDWFDRYPHGVSQTDFNDPASQKRRERGEDAVLEQKPELHTVEEFFTTLSPAQSQEGAASAGAKGGPQKRRSVAGPSKKVQTQESQMPRAEAQQLEPIRTDFSPGSTGQPQQPASARPSTQGRRPSTQQLPNAQPQSATAPGFNHIQLQQAQGGSYHGLSPISPVAVNHHFGHHHQTPTNFYSPDLLSMSMNHQVNGILQPLDRQLVFGAYGMDTGGMPQQQQQQQQQHSSAMEESVDWDSLAAPAGQTPAAANARQSGMNGRMGSNAGMPTNQGNPQPMGGFGSAGGGHEASSAWFMPFNMEPPEMGQDFNFNLDGLGGMFGGGSVGGMGTPGMMSGPNGEQQQQQQQQPPPQ